MLGLTASVILRGASGGIEKATRILIPLLFVLLVVVCIRSLTLPNAMEGLKFLFMPDFSRIDGSVVLMAMGLAFFKMSIGFGCMITYGSYFRSDTHVPFLAVRVMVCDLLVSILAGIAVFPAVFSFGFDGRDKPAVPDHPRRVRVHARRAAFHHVVFCPVRRSFNGRDAVPA